MRKLLTLLTLLVFGWGFAQAQITLPYSENLEGEGTGSTSCGAFQTFTVIQWSNTTDDDADWVIDVSGTGSSSTGPTANGGADHNPGISGGKYLYIEASGCVSDTANLVSEEIQTTGTEPNLFFEYWYHQYGGQINVHYVQARRVIGGNPQPWVPLDTLFTAPPGLDQWQQNLLDLSAYVGDTFQIRFRGVTGTSFGSDQALDDFNIYSLFQNDAGVISIDAPTSPATPGPNNVDVTVQNFGADTLFNATIEWEVNGAAQTPFAYTGSLLLNQTQAGVNIGSANIPAGLYTIKAWTSMPNMALDSNNANDTTMIFGCSAPLRGAYTAGGPGADFPDLTSMASVLSSCGIDSHTVITINPGFYSEKVNLVRVPGTDSTATLTITGVDTSLVTVSNSQGATFYLDGTDYTTIKNLTIEATGTIDCYGVQLRDTAEYNCIDSCRILMNDQTANLSDVVGVSASGNETSSITEGQNALWTKVTNNHIFGGEKSIHFEGQEAFRNVGNHFENNLMENAEDFGFLMDDQDSIKIIGNVIRGLRNAGADAFSIDDFQMFDISGNEAFDVPDFGMDLDDMNFALDGTPTSRGRIANNMISSVSDHAVEFDDIEQTDIWFNTFANTSTVSECAQFNDFTGLDVRNNIFYSDGNLAVEADDAISSALNTWNYNLYFNVNFPTLAEDGGIAQVDLATWQTNNAGINQNSVSGDPVFINGLSDLHVLSPVSNDVGDNSVPILVDIDGDVRPAATTVDIGADEFTPISDDALAVAIISPVTGCGDSNTVVTVVIRSLGLNDITNMPITINITGDATATINFTYTDTLGFNEFDTVNVGTVNTYNGGTFTFNGFVTLPGDQDVTNDSFPPITVTHISVPPIGIDGVGCGVDSAFISGFPFPGVMYNWYANINDTTPIAMGDSFLVPSIVAQNTYFLEYANNADSLSTLFNTNNGAGGNMWDVVALNTVTITNLAMNFDPGNIQVEVFYRTGTWVGNDQNQNNDWISLGQTGTFATAGLNLPTQIPLNFAVTIPAGQTYAFYVQELSGGNLVNYTNGTTVGAVLVQNSDIQILEGCGKATTTPFNASTFQPRVWNGIMYYGSTACSNIRVPVSAVTSPGVSVNLGNDTTLCGTSLTLDAGSNATFYDWSNGDSLQTSTVTMSGNYSVVVSDTFGCEETDSIDVTLNIPPSVNLGPDLLLCDGAVDTLDAGNPNAASWVWSSGGTMQMEPVSAAATISVVVTDSNNCTASDTLVVTTGQTPTAAFSSALTGGAGLEYTFTDQSTGSPASWSWNFGDNNTSTMQNPVHTYAAGGNYTVTLTVTNACGTTDTTFAIVAVGIEQALAGGVVSVYPNPNAGRFNLEFSGLNTAAPVTMRIMDVKGQVIMQNVIEQQGSFVKEIDLTRFSKGMYLMQISAEGEQIPQRIVVE